jgi:asparagine synthase (glutamine-hydrolysing)
MAMRDALAHRGPDDWGIEIIDNVGLVHTRLSIVDLSERGHQPMRRPGGRWWLSYNGEIYNHLELRRELADAPFVGNSDTETLLCALERWGPEVLPRLTGQFAFAALDCQGGRLLLSRDRFGVKPLYLARFDGGVWFASEPAALLAAGARPDPVPSAWDDLEAGAYLGGEATLLSGITRVAQGSLTTISLNDTEITSSRWHTPAADVDRVRAASLERRRRSELTDELERTLRDAVHGALLSDAPVGTLCSGGLDSSLITALAVEAKPDLVAFGASFPADGTKDEGRAARRVAKALGIEIELVEVTPPDWRAAFVPATVHHNSPLANASAVTVSQLSQRAHRCGIKVLLTGEGADELFGGYDTLHTAALDAFFPLPQRILRTAESRVLGNPKGLLDPRRILRVLRRLIVYPIRRPPAVRSWRNQLSPAIHHFPESDIAYDHHDGQRRGLETALLNRLDYSLCWLLNRMDENAMQVSVETRVPFLEPELVKLAMNLPLEARVGPWSKGILRDVARRVLPLSVAHRPKIYGMDYNAASWVEAAADPDFLNDGMLRDTLRIPDEAFRESVSEREPASRLRLWSAEVWCRSVFAGHSIGQIEQALWL